MTIKWLHIHVVVFQESNNNNKSEGQWDSDNKLHLHEQLTTSNPNACLKASSICFTWGPFNIGSHWMPELPSKSLKQLFNAGMCRDVNQNILETFDEKTQESPWLHFLLTQRPAALWSLDAQRPRIVPRHDRPERGLLTILKTAAKVEV